MNDMLHIIETKGYKYCRVFRFPKFSYFFAF